MITLRRLFASAAVGVFAFATAVRAEVSAETNAFGTYLRTVIYTNASVRNPRIWSVARPRHGYAPLNPSGDLAGDLFPVVAENAAQQRWPWVVWSHFNGNDYDLVWSRWLGTDWSLVAPVEGGAPSGDAVDPALSFSADGRPHLVWLSRGEGPTAVNLSVFLARRWMPSFRVSDVGEDATNPSVVVLTDGRIQVSYDTVVAHVTKSVVLSMPTTITDDLTPFNTGAATVATSESPLSKP